MGWVGLRSRLDICPEGPGGGTYLAGPTDTKVRVPGVTNEAGVPVIDTLPLVQLDMASGRPNARVACD